MLVSLANLKVGERAQVVKLEQAQPGYRQRLLAMGVIPGAKLQVIRKAPLGDPIELKIDTFSVSVRKKESQIVILEKLEP